MGCAAFKEKGHTLRYCCAFTQADGIPPATLLVELPRVDANEGGGAPDGSGGGGSVGSSMPIFLLTNLRRLEHFPPRTKCDNGLCLERLLVHLHHFLLRRTLKIRRTCAV